MKNMEAPTNLFKATTSMGCNVRLLVNDVCMLKHFAR